MNKQIKINIPIEKTTKETLNNNNLMFTESETKKLFKEIDLSLFNNLNLKESLNLLKESEKDLNKEIIIFNKDFKPESYLNKLIFKELFFYKDLKSFSVNKAKTTINNNKSEISTLLNKMVNSTEKQQKQLKIDINSLKQQNKQIGLNLKYKIKYYLSKNETNKINRNGFIMGKPNNRTTETTIKENMNNNINLFNNRNSFINWFFIFFIVLVLIYLINLFKPF